MVELEDMAGVVGRCASKAEDWSNSYCPSLRVSEV
jgi:hypothetical protein